MQEPISRSMKIGLPPGSLVYVGDDRSERPRITMINFTADGVFEEAEVEDLKTGAECLADPRITWINIEGVHDVATMERIGRAFNIHPLALEDIMNTEHQPKLDDYDNYLFMIARSYHWNADKDELLSDQISLVLGERYLITFLESPMHFLEPMRGRLREGKSRALKMEADYLAYLVMDAVVDQYFPLLQGIGDQIEDIEDEVLSRHSIGLLERIHTLKREVMLLRKSVVPLREMLSSLENGDSDLVNEPTYPFYRDAYDHAIRVLDLIDAYRDMLADLANTYMSYLAMRTNETMKVLTVLASIFIPLTFIAGVYGMNFKRMPEIEWTYGYAFAWFVMIATAVGMLIYFRRKQWL